MSRLIQWIAAAEWTDDSRPITKARRLTRRAILKVADPVVEFPYAGTGLAMPLSHRLATYRRLHPTYDEPLPDLIRQLASDASIAVIDVGANVGDSAAAIMHAGATRTLCVEAEPNYLRLLSQNVQRYGAAVEIEPSLITETGDSIGLSAVGGTATISATATKLPAVTFDELLRRHPDFRNADLLKIDTDGFDLAVLQSARAWLKEQQPTLFFEYDPKMLQDHGYDAADVWPLLGEAGYSDVRLWANKGDRSWPAHVESAMGAAKEALTTVDYLDVVAVGRPRT